jgi:hypothetical protein
MVKPIESNTNERSAKMRTQQSQLWVRFMEELDPLCYLCAKFFGVVVAMTHAHTSRLSIFL